jgi:RNA-directed DNA polymerase
MLLKQRLLTALPFSETELNLLIETAPFRYKEYQIAKREEGQFRKISQPTPEIKLLQTWLIDNEFQKFPIHAAAKAYKRHTGLIDNVLPHKNNRFLLKIDFENFFPSITSEKFKQFMIGGLYDEQEINLLCKVFFKNDRATRSLRLAIGAPSSPALSNILLYPLDEAINTKCIEMGITYTRYADDISFSTNQPNRLNDLVPLIPGLINEASPVDLIINTKKTVHASKKNGRRITGLILTSDNQVSIGRDRKRLLRVQIHRFSIGALAANEKESLRGYLAFLNSVEPDHIKRLKSSYGEELITEIVNGVTG